MSELRGAGHPGSGTSEPPPPSAEPVVHFAKSLGTVDLELRDLDSLFDRAAPPTYPHVGPMLNKSIAEFLIDSAREQRRRSQVEVRIALHRPPLRPEEEAAARAQFTSFFANEGELASLDLRVNRSEGYGSLWFFLPIVALAGLLAGLFYSQVWAGGSAREYLLALVYLFFITIVWVLLWDPLEVLLFDGYMIRMRIRALRKLATGSVVFSYRPEEARAYGPSHR